MLIRDLCIIKILIPLGILLLLSGCASPELKSQIIVIDKSINQAVGVATFKQTAQQTIEKNTKDKAVLSKQKASKDAKEKVIRHWTFPVNTEVSKTFSPEHLGITFDTKLGQVVRAVAAGVVIYSGDKITKHGKMIIIKHPLGFYSSYTQNRSIKVKLGDKIAQGAIIALAGKTNFFIEK